MLEKIRSEKGITIVWVEHIMGVLMRVVDRVVVLDHGEKIFDGAPKAAQADAEVVEVYLGADAGLMLELDPHRCRLRRLPGAVRRVHARQRRRGGGRGSAPTAPARPHCCASSPACWRRPPAP